MVEHDTGGAADSVRSPHGRSREAVVFVPGLRSRRPGKTKRGVVTRLARWLEMESTNRAITFTVQWHEGAVHDAEGPSRMATILRRDGQDERPVIDCYAFDWAGKDAFDANRTRCCHNTETIISDMLVHFVLLDVLSDLAGLDGDCSLDRANARSSSRRISSRSSRRVVQNRS